MGTAGCGYYFVNGPHAAEGEGPPGDDRSDIRDSVTWRKKKSHQSLTELLSHLRTGLVSALPAGWQPPPSVRRLGTGWMYLDEGSVCFDCLNVICQVFICMWSKFESVEIFIV